MSWDEDRLHRWLARRAAPAGLAGSRGHDAAVLAGDPGRVVACCDQVIAGVHFRTDAAAARVGAKGAARALSDLAATAARPRALLAALRAPRSATEAYLRGLLAGIDAEGRTHGAPLVGGDLACAPGPVSIAVTALGSLAGRRRPVGRDRARAGQAVVVTGPLGGSALGRHLAIVPRLAEGRRLARAGATAMMDVSDGLAWDLHRLARASGVRIDLSAVPLHPDAHRAARRDGRPALDHALHDGEDHELVATLPARAAERLLGSARLPGLALIGRVRAGTGLWIEREGRASRWRAGEGGWRHGT